MEKYTTVGENDKAIQSISIIRSLLNDDKFQIRMNIEPHLNFSLANTN